MENDDSVVYKWSLYHTITIICLRLCGDLMVSTTRIFDDELSDESGSVLSVYSYINILYLVGQICAIFLSPINAAYFNNNTKKITVIYSILASLLIIMFGSIYYANLFDTMIGIQSAIWLLYGISFSIYNSGTIVLSTTYSDPTKHGQIISLISLSWSISSLFYVIVAYFIDIHPSLPFILVGTILFVFAIIIQHTYNFRNINSTDSDSAAIDMKQIANVFTNTSYSILILISFLLQVASGANVVTLGSPILHDFYGLNISRVGWCTLIIFAGEFLSNLYMTKYSDKQGYFMTAFTSLSLKIICGCLILFIAFHHDKNSLFSLIMTLFMIFLVYFSWELFFVTQLYALNEAVKNDPHQNVSKRLVFISHTAICAFAKGIGVWFAAFIWNEGNGLVYIGLLLIFCSVVGICLYCLYFVMQRKKGIKYQSVDTDVQNDL